MQFVRITEDIADQLRAVRPWPEEASKPVRRQIFRQIKADNFIPKEAKLTINIDDQEDPMFMVVRDKVTGVPYAYDGADRDRPFIATASMMAPRPNPILQQATAETPVLVTDPALAAPMTDNKITVTVLTSTPHMYAKIDLALARRMLATAGRMLPRDQLVADPSATGTGTWLASGLYFTAGAFYVAQPTE